MCDVNCDKRAETTRDVCRSIAKEQKEAYTSQEIWGEARKGSANARHNC